MYARNIIIFCKKLPRLVIEGEIAKQLVRAATSVGANYIEANESLGKKDFLMRIRICRKEAKESAYWLKLLEINNTNLRHEQGILLNEAIELTKIFSSILIKSQ